jgi:hypothetical protein
MIPNNIKKHIIYVLEDDNEIMTNALDSDLDKENKKMNRLLIKKHLKIINKIKHKNKLERQDLQLIDDANEIFVNDGINGTGFHRQALELDKWLEKEFKQYIEEYEITFKITRRWQKELGETNAHIIEEAKKEFYDDCRHLNINPIITIKKMK